MIDREWEFHVTTATAPGEVVAVVGSCPQLGNWNHQGAFLLTKDASTPDEKGIWTGTTTLPADEEVHYRFFVCIILESPNKQERDYVIRRWETNLAPRVVSLKAESGSMKTHINLFGTYDGETRIDRGWLTKETVIQLKLCSNPIQIWKKSLCDKRLRVKVTPVEVDLPEPSMQAVNGIEESWDVQDVRSANKFWPIIEVAAMKDGDNEFKLQEQFGKLLEPDAFLIFQAQVMNPESVTFLVDLYAADSNKSDVPDHVGFCYMLQNNLTQSEGMATIPITSPRHQVIGQLRVEYLIVKPISDFNCDMSVSYARHWKHSWRGLEVGHRGAGSSFKEAPRSCSSIRENTIASLDYAATHGADMIEFDVQLSKDLVPVIYHDFYVCMSMKKKKQAMASGIDEHDLLQLPVKELTLSQLQSLKVYHVKECDRSSKFGDDADADERHQPFPTLQQAFQHLDPHVGFNVEIKWTMKRKDGTYELNHPFELNLYLDIILRSILQYGESRKIVLSCFHPDICTMLRLKQNKYPVLFLTQGITTKYSDYHDPRTQNIPIAVNFALSIGILGIDVHTEDILRDPSQVALVQSKGLILFCWGEDNNDQATIRYLKNLGLNGIIYDKIDVYRVKDTKESIFLVEARESSQRQIVSAALASTSTTLPPSINGPVKGN